MGTTYTQQAGQTNIGCAYLAKVLQGVKREVDSKVEVQCHSSRERYDCWRKGMQSYKDKIERAFPNDADAIISSLLLPSTTLFEQNGSICSQKQGKVVLEFSTGFLSLQESKSLHIQQNMPYTTSEIWNLLFHMVEYDLMIKRTNLPLQVRTETLYTDLRSKTVKLRNPFSFITSQFKCKHQKYLDSQKLGLLLRGLKVPPQIQKQSNVFNIGMILVEIMLLQGSCIIYEHGLSRQKHINPILHEMLIEKVLKLSYYPLKLRMVVAGLIQLQIRERFTSEEVHVLLFESRQKIKGFHTFHLRKTMFQNIFKHKLTTFEALLNKIKHDCTSQMFKQGVPVTSASETKPSKRSTPYNNPAGSLTKNHLHLQIPSGQMDQSFNFSITNISPTNRPYDLQSLNLSKSEYKSILLHEKLSPKEQSIVSNIANNNELIKHSELSIHSVPMYAPTNISATARKTIFKSLRQTTPPELSHTPNYNIDDPFMEFQPEKKTTKQKELNSFSNSSKTPPREMNKSQRQSNSLKIYQQNNSQPIKELVTPDLRLSANLQLIQSEKKISLQAGKENEQHYQDISCIRQNQKDPLENDGSRNSSVVQYVSELYENQRVMQAPLEKTKTQKVVQPHEVKKSWETEKEGGLFDSFEPKQFFIKKSESYQIQSNSHSSFEPPRQVAHQGSIIDCLTPLVKSKKAISEDNYKPDNLTDSARKRIQYWNTFSKYSPQVIAQLHLPSKYPETERLKRSMRETISYHNMTMSQTKRMFPQDERASADDAATFKIDTG